jgi:hypothetical protein
VVDAQAIERVISNRGKRTASQKGKKEAALGELRGRGGMEMGGRGEMMMDGGETAWAQEEGPTGSIIFLISLAD